MFFASSWLIYTQSPWNHLRQISQPIMNPISGCPQMQPTSFSWLSRFLLTTLFPVSCLVFSLLFSFSIVPLFSSPFSPFTDSDDCASLISSLLSSSPPSSELNFLFFRAREPRLCEDMGASPNCCWFGWDLALDCGVFVSDASFFFRALSRLACLVGSRREQSLRPLKTWW